ncbi:hypothetical protein ACTJKB_20395 [Paenibacillus sp. 22594]
MSFLLAPDPALTQRSSNQFSSGFARNPFSDKEIKSMREFLENVEGKDAGFFFLNLGGSVNRKSPKSTAFFWRKAKFYLEWNSSWIKKLKLAPRWLRIIVFEFESICRELERLD